MKNLIKSIALAGVASVALIGAASADVPQNEYTVFGDYSVFSTDQAETTSKVPSVRAQGDFNIEQADFISPEYGNRTVKVVGADSVERDIQSSWSLSLAGDPEAAYLGNFFDRPEYPL